MNLPLSDVLDRYSIELRKDFYGHGNREMIAELEAELTSKISFHCQPYTNPKQIFAIVRAAVLLGVRNSDIANLEFQLRASDPRIGLEEHGRRAIAIRAINDGRNQAKRELSEALSENAETKHYGYGNLIEGRHLTFAVQERADRPNT